MNQVIQQFEQAKWIWTDDTKTVNQYVDFQKKFILSGADDVKLYISADSDMSVCINKIQLDIHQYPDYTNYKVYESADITEYVHPGENLLEITGYCQNEDSFVYRKGIPGILFSVIEGSRTVAVSDQAVDCRRSVGYFSGAMEKFTPQLSYSFSYNLAATADTQWQPATVVPRNVSLFPRPIRELEVLSPMKAHIRAYGSYREKDASAPLGDRVYTAWLSACHLGNPPALPSVVGVPLTVADKDGLYVLIDLGQETSGYLYLDLHVPKECEILIGFGEHTDDMRVRASVGGRQFAARVFARAGRQSFTHRFKRLGCRYLQLHIASQEALIYYAGIRPVRYPVNYREEIPLTDSLHRRIFAIGRETLELCMHDHYEDCPWREQGLYGMDSMLQMMCGYVVFDNLEFPAASLRLLALGIREDGLLEICAPARSPITIPSFSLAWIIALWNYFEAGGNKELLEELRPVLEKVLLSFEARTDATGLVRRFSGAEHWNFYEWTDGLSGNIGSAEDASLSDAPLQALYVMALAAAAKITRILDDPDAAYRYEKQKLRLTVAAHRFWDEDRMAYVTTVGSGAQRQFHELTQALMVCAGLTDDERTRLICDRMIDPKTEGFVPVSLSYTMFKYMALLKNKERYEAYIWQNIADIWGPIVYSGATSFWETRQGGWDFDAAGSLCHGWASVPIWVYSQLLV